MRLTQEDVLLAQEGLQVLTTRLKQKPKAKRARLEETRQGETSGSELDAVTGNEAAKSGDDIGKFG
jgi:hypothetical protein